MTIEQNIFKKSKVDFQKLEPYGFKKLKGMYIYEQNFFDDNFKAIITIYCNGTIKGKVIDNETNDEYLNINVDINGKYISKVRELYKKILLNIKDNCFTNQYFKSIQASRITNYIENKYSVKPEFLWDNTPEHGVFRNKNNNKWFGIIMSIDRSKIEKKTGEIEIINIKNEEDEINKLITKKGFYKAYHMNKKNWISIILDDTLSDNEIIKQIDNSYNIINQK